MTTWIDCTIAGVTFTPDYPAGLIRVRRLQVTLGGGLVPVVLRPEPGNPHDPNAVEVLSPADGTVLGHLPWAAARTVTRDLAAGRGVDAHVASVGQTGDKWGARLTIRLSTP
jgi:hypothetical protein